MRRKDFFEERKLKRLIYVFTITLVISIIAFGAIFIMYNKKLKEDSSNNLLELGKLNDIVSNDELNDFEETSSTSDKNINDVKNVNIAKTSQKETSKVEVSKNDSTKKDKNENVVENKNANNTNIKSEITNEIKNENIVNTNETQENSVKETLNFIAPVSGEILKDFAIDTLIYSNTLEEWTTHSGIDIQSEKTTIVVASEAGTIESIKTDPRYGLTIVMTHNDGFKTIYSNLLTTEFVTVGQDVEKGQTIATIGESASFEIADESHLHFEMYKDGNCVNPTIYLKEI